MVSDEQQPTIEGEEPKMVEVTRTKTFKATGERDVLQNLDDRKLIPLLTEHFRKKWNASRQRPQQVKHQLPRQPQSEQPSGQYMPSGTYRGIKDLQKP